MPPPNRAGKEPDLKFKEVSIPRELLRSHADLLFDFMAGSMVAFLEETGDRKGLEGTAPPLGEGRKGKGDV